MRSCCVTRLRLRDVYATSPQVETEKFVRCLGSVRLGVLSEKLSTCGAAFRPAWHPRRQHAPQVEAQPAESGVTWLMVTCTVHEQCVRCALYSLYSTRFLHTTRANADARHVRPSPLAPVHSRTHSRCPTVLAPIPAFSSPLRTDSLAGGSRRARLPLPAVEAAARSVSCSGRSSDGR